MKRITTVIIGAGQSGLAMSCELAAQGVDHVILERGRIANSWRTERWDSLRLLTPNWQSRLPGDREASSDPDGFKPVSALIAEFDRLAGRLAAPVRPETTVLAVRPIGSGYRVQTNQGKIEADNVVIATGACAKASIPAFADDIDRDIVQATPLSYKRPGYLPDGGVLVVGASASGVQIARELQTSGRQVVLSVGSHIRLPRHYRGRDIMTWLELTGRLDERFDEVEDIERVRRSPSMQLAGSPARFVDLNALQDLGVEPVGRLMGIDGARAIFSGSLANMAAGADLKMNRLLDFIDHWVRDHAPSGLTEAPRRFAATRLPALPKIGLDLRAAGIRSVIWCSGFRPDFGFLRMPGAFDRKSRILHQGGVVAPGLYVMGLPFLRNRRSTFIDGAGDDARDLSAHLLRGLEIRRAA